MTLLLICGFSGVDRGEIYLSLCGWSKTWLQPGSSHGNTPCDFGDACGICPAEGEALWRKSELLSESGEGVSVCVDGVGWDDDASVKAVPGRGVECSDGKLGCRPFSGTYVELRCVCVGRSSITVSACSLSSNAASGEVGGLGSLMVGVLCCSRDLGDIASSR